MNLLSKYRTELYGFSILWIMIFHGNAVCHVTYFHRFPALNALDRIIAWGNMGVEVFILLAGISAYYSFSRDADILSFYKKRMKRLFFPVLLICCPYWLLQLTSGKIGISKFLLDITLLRFWVTGDQQIWFVSTIALFYLLFPGIYYMFLKRCIWKKTDDQQTEVTVSSFAALIENLIVVAGLIFIVYRFLPDYYALVEIGINRLPIFLLGIWMGPLVMQDKSSETGSLVLLILITLFGVYLLWIREAHGIYRRWLYELIGTPLSLLLAVGFSRLPDRVRAFFRFFGKMSLELYLAHIVAIRLNKLGFFFEYTDGAAKKYLILMLIAVGIAFLAYKLEQMIPAWIEKGRKH